MASLGVFKSYDQRAEYYCRDKEKGMRTGFLLTCDVL